MPTSIMAGLRSAGFGVLVFALSGCWTRHSSAGLHNEQVARSESGGSIAFLSAEARQNVCGTTAHPGRELSDSAINFAMRNDYFDWCIPEYHDDQRLHDGRSPDKDYGPIAHSFAWPELALLTDHAQFDNDYINVAIVDLDEKPDPTLEPYADLGLKERHNCLYLQHHDPWIGRSSFTALMIALGPGITKCPTAPAVSSGTPLDVKIEKYSESYADYPPVTRFVEGNRGQTLVGVQCTNRWCVVGPRGMGAVPPSAHNAVAALESPVRANVKGWFDDQKLGLPDLAGGIHRSVRASVIPDPELGNLHIAEYLGGYRKVAIVYFVDAPPAGSKYVNTFGFAQGANQVELRAQPSTEAGVPAGTLQWYARVTPQNGAPAKAEIPTNRTDHSTWLTSMPATARWRWFDTDEDVWVECDIGCCLINGRFY